MTYLDWIAGSDQLTRGRHAIVLGTGSVGRLAARLLREAGVGRLSVASRSEAGAATAATAVHGRPLRAVDVPATLADSDLLITATGCVVPAVLAEQVRAARERTGDRPLFVLDLGMPPDVEPAVGRLAGVTLVDINALGRHLADREAPDEIPRSAPSSPPRPPHTSTGRTKRSRRPSSERCTHVKQLAEPNCSDCTAGSRASANSNGPRRRRPSIASSASCCTRRPSGPSSCRPIQRGPSISKRYDSSSTCG